MSDFAPRLQAKAENIKLLILDVDGVLSDGKVYFSNQGDELKSFNIKDGLGIKLLQKSGIQVAIITGRDSKIVAHRANELGIKLVFQGRSDKRATFNELLEQLNLNADQVAHMGDDLPDMPLMKMAGLGLCVSDAHQFVQQHADWVAQTKGGEGAVREVADWLLTAQNKLASLQASYLA